MNAKLLDELTQLLGLAPEISRQIMAGYGPGTDYTEADWHEALNKLGENRRPTLGMFQAIMLRLIRNRQKPSASRSMPPQADPLYFPTRCTWLGQPVFETTDRPMSMWTLVNAHGEIERYLSDRLATHGELLHEKVAIGPKAGYRLLGTEAVYRSGVYGCNSDWQELPGDWRTRPQCQAVPRVRKPGDTAGFTRLGAVL